MEMLREKLAPMVIAKTREMLAVRPAVVKAKRANRNQFRMTR